MKVYQHTPTRFLGTVDIQPVKGAPSVTFVVGSGLIVPLHTLEHPNSELEDVLVVHCIQEAKTIPGFIEREDK